MVQTLTPFSLLNKKSFLKFLYCLDPRYVPPDRKTVRDRIQKKYEEDFIKIKELLDTVSKVNLITDIWTSIVTDPYLGVTAHYVTPKWIMRSHMLDISLFPHPHDSLSIVNALKAVQILTLFI